MHTQKAMHVFTGISCSLLLMYFLVGCAFDIAHVRYTDTRLKIDGQGTKSFTLGADLSLSEMPCGYGRTLKKETRWIV